MTLHPPTWLLTALLLGLGCLPNTEAKKECEKATDCGPTTAGGCPTCPATPSRYCEGGVCVTPSSTTTSVRITANLPRRGPDGGVGGAPVASIRYAVVAQKATNVVPDCEGITGCSADHATCEQVKRDGLESDRINVAASSASNTDTQGGTITNFPNLLLQNVPVQKGLVVAEGRTGQLGAGERTVFACTVIDPQAGTDNPTSLNLVY